MSKALIDSSINGNQPRLGGGDICYTTELQRLRCEHYKNELFLGRTLLGGRSRGRFGHKPSANEIHLDHHHQDENGRLDDGAIEGIVVVLLVHRRMQRQPMTITLLLHLQMVNTLVNASQQLHGIA